MPLIKTLDLLILLDFHYESDSDCSANAPLRCDFGNGYLVASPIVNDHFEEVIALNGYYVSSRSAGEIEAEMPRQIESVQQGLAYLAMAVGKHAALQRKPKWYLEGLKHFEELPHRKKIAAEQAAAERRPRCFVEHHWLKAIGQALAPFSASASEDDTAVFTFDGSVLNIRFAGQLAVAPASGTAWDKEYTVRLQDLRLFPKRLRKRGVLLLIHEEQLWLGDMMLRLVSSH